jgi:hypothetical protein
MPFLNFSEIYIYVLKTSWTQAPLYFIHERDDGMGVAGFLDSKEEGEGEEKEASQRSKNCS